MLHRAVPAGGCIEAIESRVLLSTIYVDVNIGGIGAHNGTSWANAFDNLEQGLIAAAAGDTVRVAKGTYRQGAFGNIRTAVYSLREGVQLMGGYAGFGATNPDARDTRNRPSVLSGDLQNNGVASDNAYHVVFAASGITSATLLDGFTIRDGVADGGGANQNIGGGMLNTGTPRLNDVIFYSNRATSSGGALFTSSSGTTTITNSEFTSNTTGDRGGGANVVSGTSRFTNCGFTFNSSTHASAGEGGALAVSGIGTSSILVNCRLSANYAGPGSSAGGAVSFRATGQLINCTLVRNTAGFGGGVYCGPGFGPTITNSILYLNDATQNIGEQIHTAGTNPVVTYSDVEGGGFAGTGNVSVDPQIVAAPSFFPDTTIAVEDDFGGDLRLRSASPLRNAGNSAAVPAGTTTDFAGNPRIEGSAVDIGAYEGAFAPTIVFVDVNATAGRRDGTSWDNAATSIPFAINAAFAGATVRVADGTYLPGYSGNRNFGFTPKTNVNVAGGYTGLGALDPNARNITAFPTILSGNIGSAGSSTDNVYHVIRSFGSVGPAEFNGVTIANGYANGGGSDGFGAAVNCINSMLSFVDCTFSNHFSQHSGGAVYQSGGADMSFTRCAFTNDNAVENGGAIAFSGASHPTIINCTFDDNSGAGGAIYCESGTTLAVSGSTFTDNTADPIFQIRGGAAYITDFASATFTSCSFVRNFAVAGGAVSTDTSGSTRLDRCRFYGNTASLGTAVYNEGAATEATSCVFVGNYGTIFGGFPSDAAIYNDGAPSALMTLRNCTITANIGNGSGTGAGVTNDNGTLNLYDSIVRGNTNGDDIHLVGATSNDVRYNDHGGLGFNGTNMDADPQFVRAPSPGPNGTWGNADDDYGDLRVQFTSPVVDRGNNGFAKGSSTSDVNGRVRFFDFPGAQAPGALVDMGAHELDYTLGLLFVGPNLTSTLPAGGYTFTVEKLTMFTGAKLDVKDDDLILRGTTTGAVTNQIKTAYNFGTWTGSSGILSSTARDNPSGNTTLGVLSSADYFNNSGATTFNTFAVNDGDVLVKYTYFGDVDFNGSIDASDYNLIDFGFTNHLTGWANGDADYSGGPTDVSDYNVIDFAFISQTSVL